MKISYPKVMMSVAVAAAMLACAGIGAEDHLNDDLPMNRRHIDVASECLGLWGGIIREWSEGVVVQDSMLAIRGDVSRDKKTKFSELIMAAWNLQKANGIEFDGSDFGEWPVSDEDFQKVVEATLLAGDGRIEEKCQSPTWAFSILGNEIGSRSSSKHKLTALAEMPKPEELGPTEAEYWMFFWLFANVK